jgi:rhodanese-related sulfurtransferase
MNRRALLAILLSTLAFPMTADAQSPAFTPNITPRQAHEMATKGEVILIDIRRPDEWASTGVPENAHLLQMEDPLFEAKLSKLAGGDRTKPIALFCRTANRTRTVQAALMQHGYTRVMNVEGGLIGNPNDRGWAAGGLPLKKAE